MAEEKIEYPVLVQRLSKWYALPVVYIGSFLSLFILIVRFGIITADNVESYLRTQKPTKTK